MTKKFIKITVTLALILVCVFSLTACNFLTPNNTTTENITINGPTFEGNLTVQGDNVVETVASIALTNTYELTAELSYTFTIGGQRLSGTSTGQATAFAINESGYLVTNAHCITVDLSEQYPDINLKNINLEYTQRNIYVNLAGKSDYQIPCDIIAYNEKKDLAILEIRESGTLRNGNSYTVNAGSLPYAVFFAHQNPNDENSTVTLNYGELTIAVGNANGYGMSVTTGVVSAPLRFDNKPDMNRAIQTDTTINPGNSGGPLFNQYCAVIGVNSFKIVEENVENMNYAIPTYDVIAFIESLADGSYDKINTLGSDGNIYTSTVDIKYYTTTERAYSSTGENVTAH